MVKINNKLISSERRKHQWSQQQLADMTGLSLRTVQRIENNGNASHESIRALASVFEISSELLVVEKNKLELRYKLAVIFSSIVTFFYFTLASAQPVMLDVVVNSAQKNLASVQLLNGTGEESELKIDKVLTVTFTAEPTKDKQIRIKVKAYELSGGADELLGTPAIITSNRQAATIKFEGRKGAVYEIVITPDYSVSTSN